MKGLSKFETVVNLTDLDIPSKTCRKRGVITVASVYEKTDLLDKDEKARRLRSCGNRLVYGETKDGDHVLLAGYFCQLRLCPSCSWYWAKRVFNNVYSIITHPDFSGKRFIFLTLTIRNCRGEVLSAEIKRILSGWNKLTLNDNKPFRRSFAGTFRALEVTYNPVTKKYHPHLHAMAAVEPGYFKKTNQDYISHDRLVKLWREACALDYDPAVRIQRVKNTTAKQVAEVAKYTVKSADYLNRPEVVEVLDLALRRKRLVAYGGLFREVRDKLELPDEEAAAGPDVSPGVAAAAILNPYVRKIFLEWRMGSYEVVIDSLTDSAAATVAIDASDWGIGDGGQGGV